MAQERLQKTKQTDETKQEVVEEVKAKDAQELKDELDELLDEIDGVLEVNAEEFIRNYVQKGGELCRTVWFNVRIGFKLTVLQPLRGFVESLQHIRV